jgi:hypothetical protein
VAHSGHVSLSINTHQAAIVFAQRSHKQIHARAARTVSARAARRSCQRRARSSSRRTQPSSARRARSPAPRRCALPATTAPSTPVASFLRAGVQANEVLLAGAYVRCACLCAYRMLVYGVVDTIPCWWDTERHRRSLRPTTRRMACARASPSTMALSATLSAQVASTSPRPPRTRHSRASRGRGSRLRTSWFASGRAPAFRPAVVSTRTRAISPPTHGAPRAPMAIQATVCALHDIMYNHLWCSVAPVVCRTVPYRTTDNTMNATAARPAGIDKCCEMKPSASCDVQFAASSQTCADNGLEPNTAITCLANYNCTRDSCCVPKPCLYVGIPHV